MKKEILKMDELEHLCETIEVEAVLSNETNQKRWKTKDGWMFLIVFFLLAGSFLFSACSKDKEEEDKGTEYVALDRDLLGDQMDFAILGSDGMGYFYEIQEEQPIPDRLTIYDGSKNSLELVVNFDEKGLPKSALSEDYSIVFGNYEGNRFNAVVITKDGESYLLEGLETDINWDEYTDDLIAAGEDVANQSLTRGLLGDLVTFVEKNIANKSGKIVNSLISSVSCGTSIYFGYLPGLFDCGEAVIGWLDVFDVDLPPILKDVADLYTLYNTYTVLDDCETFTLECLDSAVDGILTMIDYFERHSEYRVNLGEGILITGSGNVKVTLIWDNYSDIDLHCIDPAGEHIYFRNLYSEATGGYLDYDNVVGYGPENIYFNPAPLGTYQIYLHYYDDTYTVKSVNYMVAIFVDGKGDIYEGTISGKGSIVEIATFSLDSNNRSVSVDVVGDKPIIEWNNLPKK